MVVEDEFEDGEGVGKGKGANFSEELEFSLPENLGSRQPRAPHSNDIDVTKTSLASGGS